MSNYLVAFIAALGIGGWAYAKTKDRTGGNTQSALRVGLVTVVAAWVILVTLFSFLS